MAAVCGRRTGDSATRRLHGSDDYGPIRHLSRFIKPAFRSTRRTECWQELPRAGQVTWHMIAVAQRGADAFATGTGCGLREVGSDSRRLQPRPRCGRGALRTPAYAETPAPTVLVPGAMSTYSAEPSLTAWGSDATLRTLAITASGRVGHTGKKVAVLGSAGIGLVSHPRVRIRLSTWPT
jgi:hypothetical protein